MRQFHAHGPVDAEQHFCVKRKELVDQCVQQLIGYTEKGGHHLIVALAISTGIVLDIAGALHIYGIAHLMGQKLSLAIALLLFALATGWLLIACISTRSGPPSYQERQNTNVSMAPTHWQRLYTVLIFLAWLATMRNLIVFLPPPGPFPLLHTVILSGGTLALLFTHIFPPPPVWVLGIALFLGSFARISSLAQMPIDPARDDMLPLVLNALHNVTHGQTPYTTYSMPWELPLTYLPATWLAYLPPYLLQLDIRITNIAAEVLVGAALLWSSQAKSNRCLSLSKAPIHAGETTDSPPCMGGLGGNNKLKPHILLWAWFYLQPAVMNWSLTTTIPIFWAWLCLLFVLHAAHKPRLAAAMLGVCIAASPMTSLVVPFILLTWLRTHTKQHVLLFVGIAGTIAALIILPFLLWSPQQFIFGTWRWFNDNNLYPRLRWEMDNTWAHQVGFSGVFWRHGWVGILKPLQMLMLTTLAALFWFFRAHAQQVAPFTVAAILFFMVINPVLWPYLYSPAFVAALVSCITISHPFPERIEGLS